MAGEHEGRAGKCVCRGPILSQPVGCGRGTQGRGPITVGEECVGVVGLQTGKVGTVGWKLWGRVCVGAGRKGGGGEPNLFTCLSGGGRGRPFLPCSCGVCSVGRCVESGTVKSVCKSSVCRGCVCRVVCGGVWHVVGRGPNLGHKCQTQAVPEAVKLWVGSAWLCAGRQV